MLLPYNAWSMMLQISSTVLLATLIREYELGCIFILELSFVLLIGQVLEMGSLSFGSKCDLSSASGIEDRMHVPKNFNSPFSTSGISIEMQREDLYDQFEIKVDDFAVRPFPFESFYFIQLVSSKQK